MKTFLKPIVSVLAVTSLLVAGSTFAQYQKAEKNWSEKEWHKGPPSVEQQLARLSDALDLSDEQSAEMLAILQEQEKTRQALQDRTMELMGAEICAHKAQSEEEILSILDAEQTELFLQMREERQFRANDKTRSRKGRDPLDCSGYEGGGS
jgi:hypothetical protein